MRTLTGFLLIAALLGCPGCSDSGPQRASVSGTVTLDGKPLARGSINFIPTEGTAGPTAGATIENGSYRVDRAKGVTVGKNLVRINSVQPTGRKTRDRFGGGTTDEWAEVLPAEYHSKSDLVRSIEPGSNVLDFDLKSEPGR